MNRLFFDTSALVKRYYEEPGTETVDTLIEGESTVVISSLAVVETVSAFRRKYNRDGISELQMNRLLSAFFEEALAEFVILPMDELAFQFSFLLVLEHNLRTLNSLQLSAALTVDTENKPVTFVSADTELVATADANGLTTVNPDE